MKMQPLWTRIVLGFLLLFAAGEGWAQASADTDPIFHHTVVDKAPVPKRRIRPDFPSSLRKRDTPAEITLGFIVTKEGDVTDIRIVKFNDPDIVDPVYAAYEEAKYTPGEKNGKPVRTNMEVTEIYPQPKPTPAPKPTPTPKPKPSQAPRR